MSLYIREFSKITKGINQSDMYQLFAYGKKYKVNKVVLIYPQWKNFNKKISFSFDDNLSLDVAPFPLNENNALLTSLAICKAK